MSLQKTEFNVVYTRSTVWSTVATSKHITYAEICDAGDIHLVYFGKGTFTELMKKPSSQMPTVHLYYEPLDEALATPSTSTKAYPEEGHVTPPTEEYSAKMSQQTENNIKSQLVSEVPAQGHDHNNGEKCSLHGCNIMSETPETAEYEAEMSVKFPQAYKVCKATTESAIVEFNPVEESELRYDRHKHTQTRLNP